MELGQFCEKTKDIFEIEDISELSDRLLDICINNRSEYMAEFKELVQDLSVDWLQKIYQYYEADRKNQGQDFTPKSLARFVGKLSETENEKTVFDLCAGSGALTIQKWNLNKDLSFICYEYDKKVIPFLMFNLAVRNIDGYVIHGDALTDETFATYRVFRGDRFSTIASVEDSAPTADICISNPPYNMRWESASLRAASATILRM